MNYIAVDDGKTFDTHAEILNKVFKKTKKDGSEYQLAIRSGYEIKPGKRAAFFKLAEREEGGGWIRPETNADWLNIPDPDERGFTQLALSAPAGPDCRPETEYAVFMLKKTPAGNPVYVFYGIFTHAVSSKDSHSTYFSRKNTVLIPAEWQE